MQSLKERVEADGTNFILATFTDMAGKPCAKLVPISALAELEEGKLGFAGFAAGLLGQQPKDPDVCAIPDPASYLAVPFIKPGLAIVQCDLAVNGKPWAYTPRVILQSVLDELALHDITVKIGAEVEYFLLKRDEGGRIITADDHDNLPQPCYDARGVTRMYDHLSEISAAMNTLNWGNYANDHEDAAGQFEQNFEYDDALVTADRVVALRYIINMIANKRDMISTFMPKPFSDRSGNGFHVHLSLWRKGKPLFPDANDAKGLGLSSTAYGFIAGVLSHSAGLSAYLAPTVNSYKRRGAVNSRSGATWSPRFATYGGNDRTHFIRVPDENRIEIRGGDGSANPYLLIAAVLAAGLDGMNRELDPGHPAQAGEIPEGSVSLPRTLLHAVEALRGDDVLVKAFGDPDIPHYYADRKEEEFLDWHNTVSDWEIEHYLTAV